MSSPEELLLVAIAAKKTGMGCCYLSYGLAAAAFGDLLIAGQFVIEDERVRVKDNAPAGDEVSQLVIAKIRESRPRKLAAWINRLGSSRQLRHTVRASLLRKGLINSEEKPIFGLIPHTVYTVTDSALAERIRRRVLESLRDLGRAPARDALELGIAAQVDVGLLRKEEKKAVVVLQQSDPAVKAVREVIRDLEAAAAATSVLAVVNS